MVLQLEYRFFEFTLLKVRFWKSRLWWWFQLPPFFQPQIRRTKHQGMDKKALPCWKNWSWRFGQSSALADVLFPSAAKNLKQTSVKNKPFSVRIRLLVCSENRNLIVCFSLLQISDAKREAWNMKQRIHRIQCSTGASSDSEFKRPFPNSSGYQTE